MTPLRCLTRAFKNDRYLKEKGFDADVDVDVLARLHRLRHDSPELREHEALSTFVRHRGVPPVRDTVSEPLFHGTIHFAKVVFETPNGAIAMDDDDMSVIVKYARNAAVPISAYASQYGPNSISIAPAILQYTVNTTHAAFGDAMLRSWVDDLATKHNLGPESCISIIVPSGIRAGSVSANAGYHGLSTIPYIVMGVHARDLTLQDTADAFAMVVSHEIAEMVVDPKVDAQNPEVCDPCDLNCDNLTRDYFRSAHTYLGSNRNSPPGGFDFAYYTCAIVKPHGASRCPASHADCQYAPP